VTLPRLREQNQAGQHYVYQAKATLKVVDAAGCKWDLLRFLEAQHSERIAVQVRLGVKEQVAVRLLAVRVPPQQAKQRRERAKQQAGRKHKRRKTSPARLRLADWTVLITNVAAEQLSLDEALVLQRLRWQIELLWKLWKQHAQVDQWRSKKPWRILTEAYAKLLGLLIEHWLVVLGCWQDPNRSLMKAYQAAAGWAGGLLLVFRGLMSMPALLTAAVESLALSPGLQTRRQHPSSAQYARQPTLIRA
jgi:hypothetical protein